MLLPSCNAMMITIQYTLNKAKKEERMCDHVIS
jgi:hypothetical protein